MTETNREGRTADEPTKLDDAIKEVLSPSLRRAARAGRYPSPTVKTSTGTPSAPASFRTELGCMECINEGGATGST